jgi:hypothetical protein
MTHHNTTNITPAQADPACKTCPSNETVTEQESWILKEMRGLKDQMRPVAQRLFELEDRIKKPTLQETDDQRNAEWAKLEGQMADLRKEWQKWQERLDEAIEQKLICLGHIEPK